MIKKIVLWLQGKPQNNNVKWLLNTPYINY